MRKRKPLPLLRNLEITGIGSEGKAIARYGEMVVFVRFGAPGDVADVQVTRKRRRYMEGRIVKLHSVSGMRTIPFCEHFGTCGGCKWQHLSYENQLHFKQQEVADHFSRIGKIEFPVPDPVVPSPKTKFYRNKLEFTFTNRRWLTEEETAGGAPIEEHRGAGFHIPGRFDKVLDIRKCWLQEDPSNQVRLAVRDYARKEGLEFFDLVKQQGFLRTLIVRTSSVGEVMVIVVFFSEDKSRRERLLDHIARSFPEITSLMYVINPKANDTIQDLDVLLYNGKDHIVEIMGDLRFRIGPKSFYQTNSVQAHELYRITRDYAGLQGHEVVYDLYTGTGTIAVFLARHCRNVLGLEYVPEAIEDARYNANLNGIGNVDFLAGDIKDLINPALVEKYGAPHTVVTDPPRTGMHPAVVRKILDLAPAKIVYVSCNSATQARDIQLMDSDYRVERLRAADMFPHTQHIENVVLLSRRW